MSQSGWDDHEHAPEKATEARALERDAPGLEIGGPAAVAQAAELMESPQAAREPPAAARAAHAMTRPTRAPSDQPEAPTRPAPLALEAAQPAVTHAPDGGGGGGTEQRGVGAARRPEPGPSAAIDAALQLQTAEALQRHALLDEPAARTPVALRRKKRRPAPAAVIEVLEEVAPDQA